MQLIDDQAVIPVVGQDLLSIERDGRRTLLYQWLADELANRLEIPGSDLPVGDELQELARRYLATSNDVQDIYRELRVILKELAPTDTPRPLEQLAEFSKLKLFVTTTFDYMMERAVNAARYGGQRQTLVFSYAPNDKQDLPREFDRLNRPTVYQLMGRFSSTPHSYAVTREDTLRFIQSLQAKTEDSPHFLFDKMKRSHLLIIGSHFADWLTSFFIRGASGGRHVEIPLNLATDAGAHGSVVFLQRFSGGTRVYRGAGAVEFVDELARRWRDAWPSGDSADAPPPIGEFRSGAVYLSATRADQRLAESIRDALDQSGVDVVLDTDDEPIAERWEKKLRSFLSESSVFMPVFTSRSTNADRRFLRAEWVEAIVEARKAVPSGRFVVPVVAEENALAEHAIPAEFGKLDWERWKSNQPGSKLVDTVVQLQRDYRSASFA